MKSNFFRIRFPRLVYDVLTFSLGMKAGEKVITNAGYPDFVFNSCETWNSVIDQAISDDGWIGKQCVSIVITVDATERSRAPKILIHDKTIFNKQGIKVNGPKLWKKYQLNLKGKKHIREQWHIFITGKDSFTKLHFIGISHKGKNLLIKKTLQSYKQDQFTDGENIFVALRKCKELFRENEDITINEVARLIQRHPWRTSQILKQLVDLHYLGIIREYYSKVSPRIFNITSKGWRIK